MLAFDYETHKIQPGLLAPPVVCAAVWPSPEPLRLGEEALDTVSKLIRGATLLVGHNIAYDFCCHLAARPEDGPYVWDAYRESRVYDTGIAALLNAIYEGRLQDKKLVSRKGVEMPGRRYRLSDCVEESLGRSDAKEHDRFRTSYALLDGLPLEQWPLEARQYPVDDSRNTFEVAEAQLAANYYNLHDMPKQAWAGFCMQLGAVWGLRTNPERVEAFATEVLQKQAALKERFQKEGIYRFTGSKLKQKLTKDTKKLKQLVFDAYLGEPPRTDTGGVQCDRVALEESGVPLLEDLAEVSNLDKLASYIPSLQQAAVNPLNVEPNVLVASGRSSYKGLIGLMPRKGGVRNTFEARAGMLYCSVDWSAVELSALAQVCIWMGLDSELARAINDGKDPHVILASTMTGMAYDEYVKRKKEPELAEKRQAGKAGNFGFPGMMGAPKFVIAQRKQGFKVCEWFFRDGKCGAHRVREYRGRPLGGPMCMRCLERAQELRQFYLQTWGEIPHYWQKVQQLLADSDDRLLQFVSGRVRGGLHAPSAANTLFQGLVGDAIKEAVIQLTEAMYFDSQSPLFGSRLLIVAHDESFAELKADRAHEAAQEQTRIMLAAAKKFMPDVRVSAEPALMKHWYKEAEAVYVDGKLVPWVPRE